MPPEVSIVSMNTTPALTPSIAPVPPLQIGKFKASKMIVLQSWDILKKDKEIMWFPVFSSIASIIALVLLGTMIFFGVFGGDVANMESASKDVPAGYVYGVFFVYLIMMYFIVNFFETGIYTIAHGRFNGQDLSFRDGMSGAIENSGKIFLWSLISATVGLVLQMIADRFKFVGRIVAFFLGAAWGILTYFSLLSLVIGKTSVKDSFKQSASVIRKTWGETIIVNLGVSAFFMLLVFMGIALTVGVIVLVPTLVVASGMMLLLVIYMIVLAIISSALSAIFKLAIYEYATTGKVPLGFSPELIQNAVKSNS